VRRHPGARATPHRLAVIGFRPRAHLIDMRSEPEAFDPETELFLSNAPTLPEFEPLPLELAPPRRRTLGLWVIVAMILCASILASALSR
jgi:hypothetical protein